MRSKYIFLHVDSQFMCQSLNLSWIKVVQNAGCVFVYICGGYKNKVILCIMVWCLIFREYTWKVLYKTVTNALTIG